MKGKKKFYGGTIGKWVDKTINSALLLSIDIYYIKLSMSI